MSVDKLEPWIDCENCGRRSPPDFDTYDDVIMHNCAADEWIGLDLEGGRVRGPYPSHEGPWPNEDEQLEKDLRLLEEYEKLEARGEAPDLHTFFSRPPMRELSEEEVTQFQGFVRERFDEAAAEADARMAREAGDGGA